MADVAIVNASPLILLARGGHAGILPLFYKHILIPRPVADEILVRGGQDVTVSVMRQADWLEVVTVNVIPRSIEMWGLGAGESSVIALSLEMAGVDVIITEDRPEWR
jgi:predicted nucleic acid-binding protein